MEKVLGEWPKTLSGPLTLSQREKEFCQRKERRFPPQLESKQKSNLFSLSRWEAMAQHWTKRADHKFLLITK